MAKHRKQYTEEFKRDSVRMMHNRGQRTVARVADDLGMNTNQLHRWAAKYKHAEVAKRNDTGRPEDAGRLLRRRRGSPHRASAHWPNRQKQLSLGGRNR